MSSLFYQINVIIFRMSHRYWERRMEPLGTESYFSVIKTMGSSCQSLKLSKRRNFSASSQVTLQIVMQVWAFECWLRLMLRSAERDSQREPEQRPVRPGPSLHEHWGRGGSGRGRANLPEPSVWGRGLASRACRAQGLGDGGEEAAQLGHEASPLPGHQGHQEGQGVDDGWGQTRDRGASVWPVETVATRPYWGTQQGEYNTV